MMSLHYFYSLTVQTPKFLFFFKDLFERERDVSRRRGRGRESQTDSPLSVEPIAGLNPMTLKS